MRRSIAGLLSVPCYERKGLVKCLKEPFSIMYTKQGTGIIRHFLTKKGSKAQVQVVGKAVYPGVPGGGYGMEILCVLQVYWTARKR